MHTKPVLVDLKFQVAATAALGISNLKGPTVANVFMHSTNATPSALPGANPALGNIVVQLQDNYQLGLLPIKGMITSPNSGSDLKVDNSALTVGAAYVITTLGNSTVAQWQTLGVPPGITPAVGIAFIAKLIGIAGEANTSTSKVQIASSVGSAVAQMEILGSLSGELNPNPAANQGYGAQIIIQCRDYAGALINPVDGSIIHLAFYLSDSSVTVQGS